MEWKVEETSWEKPSAVLYDKEKVVVKIYLSPNEQKLRIYLPELNAPDQIEVKAIHQIIDFSRRTP